MTSCDVGVTQVGCSHDEVIVHAHGMYYPSCLGQLDLESVAVETGFEGVHHRVHLLLKIDSHAAVVCEFCGAEIEAEIEVEIEVPGMHCLVAVNARLVKMVDSSGFHTNLDRHILNTNGQCDEQIQVVLNKQAVELEGVVSRNTPAIISPVHYNMKYQTIIHPKSRYLPRRI